MCSQPAQHTNLDTSCEVTLCYKRDDKPRLRESLSGEATVDLSAIIGPEYSKSTARHMPPLMLTHADAWYLQVNFQIECGIRHKVSPPASPPA